MDKFNIYKKSKNLIGFSLASLIIIFGSLNPNNNLDYFLSFIVSTTFLTSITITSLDKSHSFEKVVIKFFYLISLLLIIALYLSLRFNAIFLIYAVPFLLITVIILKKIKNNNILITILLVIFLISSFINGEQTRNVITNEPQPRTYLNDQLIFLRIGYLVKKGVNYYEAHDISHTEDGRLLKTPKQVWGWRLPTYSYVWSHLPGNLGKSTYWLFVILSLGTIYASFKLASLFLPSHLAVLSAYLIYPYFHFAARDIAFLEIEWWGITIFIFSFYSYFKKRFNLMAIFLFFTLIIREIFIVHVLALLFLTIVNRDKETAIKIILAIAAFFIFWFYHYFKVSNYIGTGLNTLSSRDHPFGLSFLQLTMAYASWEYLSFTIKPFLLVAIASLLSAAYLIKKGILFQAKLALVVVPFSMVLATLKIGTYPFDDYWGISFVPLILLALPILLFKSIIPTEK